MIQKKTWHEYSNELKQFLCDVATSRWARYLYYPLGVFIAIMYTTSQAGAHEIIAGELGTTVYFAHPYSSWEKGAIENMNGLVRQYIPKKADFKGIL